MLDFNKKLFMIVIVVMISFSHLFTQSYEYGIINTACKLCLKERYVRAEELLKTRMNAEKLTNDELKYIHLFLGLSYLKMDKLYMAEMEIEEALRLDPELVLTDEIFDEEVRELVEEIKSYAIGALKIMTVPDSADVYINKKKAGVSPLTINSVYSDNVEITFVKDNYYLVNRNVFVFPADTTVVKQVLRWSDFSGILEIRTSPKEADIYINDVFEGVSPVFFGGLGQFKVRIEKEGYVPETRMIEIERRKTTRFLQLLLEKKDQLLYSQLIPGLGQFRHGYIKHGIFFSTVSLGYLAYYFDYVQDNDPLKGKPLMKTYSPNLYYIGDRIVSGPEYTAEMQRREQALYDFDNKKTRIMALGIGLYILNCIDTFFIIRKDMKEKMEEERRKYNVKVSANNREGRITFSYRF